MVLCLRHQAGPLLVCLLHLESGYTNDTKQSNRSRAIHLATSPVATVSSVRGPYSTAKDFVYLGSTDLFR